MPDGNRADIPRTSAEGLLFARARPEVRYQVLVQDSLLEQQILLTSSPEDQQPDGSVAVALPAGVELPAGAGGSG